MFVGMDVHKEAIDVSLAEPADESLRGFVRAREDAVGPSTQAQHR